MQVNQIRSYSGKFVMQLAKAPDPAQLLLDAATVYLAGDCEAKVNAPKLWTHIVQAYSRGAFDKLNELLDTEKSPKIYVRFGVSDGSTSFLTDWEPQVLISVKTQPSPTPTMPHGYSTTILTGDLLYRMMKTERVSSRKGKINDIVSAIALENGFEKLAIEATSGDYALVQSYETDYEFVIDRLLRMATNADGSSQFLFYARGGFLHFHTVNFQVGGIFAFDYGAPSNTLTNVSLVNRTNTNDRTPASGIKLVAYDPLAGTTTIWETRPDLELSYANTFPTVEGTVYSMAHVGQNQLTALYGASQSQFVDAKDDLHEVGFIIDNYPFIGVGDVIRAQFVNGEGDPWSGFYYVRSVHHKVDNARVTSHYSIMRGEFVSDNPNVGGKQLSEPQLSAAPLTTETTGNFPALRGGSVVEVNSPEGLLTPPPAG